MENKMHYQFKRGNEWIRYDSCFEGGSNWKSNLENALLEILDKVCEKYKYIPLRDRIILTPELKLSKMELLTFLANVEDTFISEKMKTMKSV